MVRMGGVRIDKKNKTDQGDCRDACAGVDTLTHGSRPNEARLIHAADVVRPPPLSASCDPARGLALLATLKATEQSIDTSTAAGKAFLDMLGVFAEFETNLRRERKLEGISKAK